MLRRVDDLALGFVGLSFLLIGLAQAALAKSMGVPALLVLVGVSILVVLRQRA